MAASAKCPALTRRGPGPFFAPSTSSCTWNPAPTLPRAGWCVFATKAAHSFRNAALGSCLIWVARVAELRSAARRCSSPLLHGGLLAFCGFKSLKRHLATRYGMTPEEYRAKWNLPSDYLMVAPNYAAARSALAKTMGLGRNTGQKPKKRGRK